MNNFSQFLNKNKPGFLLGSGIGLLLSAIASAYILGPMAKEAVENEKERKNVDELSPKDLIKTAGPYLVPTVMLAVGGTFCVVKGDKLNIDNGTAALAAYTLLERSDREYREKTREIVGEKKEKRIREEIAQDRVKNNPVSQNTVMVTGNGDSLCYDAYSDRYFKSSIDRMKRIETNLDGRMLDQGYQALTGFVSLNELYYELGMKGVEQGDLLGWNLKNGYIQMKHHAVITDDNQACIVMEFRDPEPRLY